MATNEELLDEKAHPRCYVPDLAQLFQMSETGVYNALRRGQIPGARRLGGRWFIPTAAIRRFLQLDDRPRDDAA